MPKSPIIYSSICILDDPDLSCKKLTKLTTTTVENYSDMTRDKIPQMGKGTPLEQEN